jgi:hypothetical protein
VTRAVRVAILCLGLLLPVVAPGRALALDGENSKIASGGGYRLWVRYTAQDQGREAFLETITAKARVPGARTHAQVCAEAVVHSEGREIYRSKNKCSQYGPGFKHATHEWKLYEFRIPLAPLLVVRGNNMIRIFYAYQYGGMLNRGSCNEGLCGADNVSIQIP